MRAQQRTGAGLHQTSLRAQAGQSAAELSVASLQAASKHPPALRQGMGGLLPAHRNAFGRGLARHRGAAGPGRELGTTLGGGALAGGGAGGFLCDNVLGGGLSHPPARQRGQERAGPPTRGCSWWVAQFALEGCKSSLAASSAHPAACHATAGPYPCPPVVDPARVPVLSQQQANRPHYKGAPLRPRTSSNNPAAKQVLTCARTSGGRTAPGCAPPAGLWSRARRTVQTGS